MWLPKSGSATLRQASEASSSSSTTAVAVPVRMIAPA
jgi:hypothetical protein